MSEDFVTHTAVFCHCGHLMNDAQGNVATCINPSCEEYGVSYVVTVMMSELHEASAA